MKKSTLTLVIIAICCWSFYFWQEKKNKDFLVDTQALICNTIRKSLQFRKENNDKFILKATRNYKNKYKVKRSKASDKVEKKLYQSIPTYLDAYFDFTNGFGYQNAIRKYDDKNYVFDEERKDLIKLYSDSLQQDLKEHAKIHSINWNQNHREV